MGGNVVSLTTDGFITNIEDLENKITQSTNKINHFFLKYRSLRFYLSNTITALDVNYKCKGIVRLTTII